MGVIKAGDKVKRKNSTYAGQWSVMCDVYKYDVSEVFTIKRVTGTSIRPFISVEEFPAYTWSMDYFDLVEEYETKPVQSNTDDIIDVATRFAEVQQQIKELQKEADMLFKKINALTTK